MESAYKGVKPVFLCLKLVLKPYPTFWQCLEGTLPRLNVRDKLTMSFRCPFICFIYWIYTHLDKCFFNKRCYICRLNVKLIDSSAFNVTEAFWRTAGAFNISLVLSPSFGKKPSPLTNKCACTSQSHCLSTAQVALTHWFIFKSGQNEWEKKSLFSISVYVCVWALLQEFQGQGPYYECGMRNQHLHCKNGYVNTEATIIRRRGVGTGGDGVPIGLLAITPLTACPL